MARFVTCFAVNPRVETGVQLQRHPSLGEVLCLGQMGNGSDCVLGLMDFDRPPHASDGRLYAGRVTRWSGDDIAQRRLNYGEQIGFRVSADTIDDPVETLLYLDATDQLSLGKRKPKKTIKRSASAYWQGYVGSPKYLATVRGNHGNSHEWAAGLMRVRPGEQILVRPADRTRGRPFRVVYEDGMIQIIEYRASHVKLGNTITDEAAYDAIIDHAVRFRPAERRALRRMMRGYSGPCVATDEVLELPAPEQLALPHVSPTQPQALRPYAVRTAPSILADVAAAAEREKRRVALLEQLRREGYGKPIEFENRVATLGDYEEGK